MNLAEVGIWLSVSAGLSALYLVIVAVVAWGIGRWVHCLLMAGLVALHVALGYSFEIFLNEFFTDPRVVGGLLLIGVLSLVLGIALDGLLERFRTGIARGALLLAGASRARASRCFWLVVVPFSLTEDAGRRGFSFSNQRGVHRNTHKA